MDKENKIELPTDYDVPILKSEMDCKTLVVDWKSVVSRQWKEIKQLQKDYADLEKAYNKLKFIGGNNG